MSQGLARSVRLFRLFLREQTDARAVLRRPGGGCGQPVRRVRRDGREDRGRHRRRRRVLHRGIPGPRRGLLPLRARSGRAVRRRRPREGAVLADGYWLPVRDGGADICFSSNVLEHVADPIGLIGEMIRVTRPGGLIYLSFMNWYSPWGGHEMSPWHYLGPRFAERRYRRRHGREPKHQVGRTLYRLHIGPTLRLVRSLRRDRDRRRPAALLPALVPGRGPRSVAAGGADLEPPAGAAAEGVTEPESRAGARRPGPGTATPARPPLRIEWPTPARAGRASRSGCATGGASPRCS